jgi:hypothetical protein
MVRFSGSGSGNFLMIRRQGMQSFRWKLAAANRRLLTAMACYCILIVIALYALLPVRSSNEGFILGVVLLVFAVLIVKTLAHAADEDLE